MADEAPMVDVRVERRGRNGFSLVPNEEGYTAPVHIDRRQAQQILDGLWRLGLRPGE